MNFTEEDLEAITEEDLQQPCTRGEKCPQEDIGLHSRACKVEMELQAQRPLGQSWDDVLQEQEAFNGNQSEWTLDQKMYRYNHEERGETGRRSKKEAESDEEDM